MLNRLALPLWIFLCFPLGAALAQSPDDNRSLGDIAREAREQKRLHPQDASPNAAHIRELIADLSGANDVAEYRGQMAELLRHEDFDGLEHAADSARARKGRFPGGVWKLYTFYDAISQPPGAGQASEAGWNAHISLLKRWITHTPQSSTARVALAQAYSNHGGKARGKGYADTVSDEGWQKYGEGADMAFATLKEVPNRDPYWYFAMMLLALEQGWDKSRTKALLEESISFEPDFYHVYRQYANYLEPRWYGAPGEAEAFANAISQRLGGEEGAFVYFEIATVLYCGLCDNPVSPSDLPWPKIKEGYAALEHLYGTSQLKMNRFALLAARFGDKSAARDIFALIGDRWDPEVWRDRRKFDLAKNWAEN